MATGQIVIHTDGACKGNPGPGGWAAVLQSQGHTLELSGYEANTTNNRMELQAVLEALKALKQRDLPVRVVTDSRYLKDAFTKNWLRNWQRNGWQTSGKQPVKNRDLWEDLLKVTKDLQIRWEWTKGHANNALNNRCDELANEAISERRPRLEIRR